MVRSSSRRSITGGIYASFGERKPGPLAQAEYPSRKASAMNDDEAAKRSLDAIARVELRLDDMALREGLR